MFSFLRDAGTLSIATAIGYGLGIVSLPLLTRIYGPAAFGVLAAFIAISTFARYFATFTAEETLVIPKDDDNAIAFGRALVAGCLVLATILTAVSGAMWAFGKEIWLNLPGPVVMLLGPGAGFLGLSAVLQMSAVRAQMFRAISLAIVMRAVCSLSVLLILGFLLRGGDSVALVTALCAGQVCGDAAASITLAVPQLKLFDLRPHVWVAKARQTIKVHRGVLSAMASSQLIANAYMPIAVLALTMVTDATTVGWYSMAIRIIGLPATLMAKSISNVFRQRAAQARSLGRGFSSLIVRVRLVAAAIALLPYGIIIALGPSLFSWVLGAQWERAGVYASVLAVAAFCSFVVGVTDRSAMILNRSRYIVSWHSFRLLTEGGGALALILGGLSTLHYVMLVTGLRVLVYAIEFVYVHFAAIADEAQLAQQSDERS